MIIRLNDTVDGITNTTEDCFKTVKSHSVTARKDTGEDNAKETTTVDNLLRVNATSIAIFLSS